MGAAISWKNFFYDTSLTRSVAVTSSNQMTSISVDTSYPEVNAFDGDPSKVTRVNYVRNATAGGYALFRSIFSTTLGNSKTCRVIGAMNIRIPAEATSVVLTAYTYLLAASYSITFTMANLSPIPGTTDRYNLIADMGADFVIASVAILVNLPVSTSGYLEKGEVWAGPALTFDEGVGANWKHGIVDPSEVERARGGALVSHTLPRRRKLTCEFDAKTYAIAMGTPGSSSVLSYRQFMHEAGVSSPVIVIPRGPLNVLSPTAEELHALQTQAMYASFMGQHEIGHLGANLFRSSGVFEEIR